MSQAPENQEDKPSRARLAVLVLILLALLVMAGRRFGHGILYAFRHTEATVVPHEGDSVLPQVRHEHAPGAMRESHPLVAVGQDKTGERPYVLLVPAREPAPGVKLPLVFVLHGDGGTAASFHAGYPFELATGDAAIVVYPNGIRATWDLDTQEGNHDVAYLEAIAQDVAKSHPVDTTRVFGTGYSSGGFFVNLMACERPGFFRAIASNAGGAPYGRAESFPNGFPKCKDQKPIPMMALHGTQDFGVTLDSGAFSAQYWAYVNGCDTGALETTAYGECHAYRKCPKDKPVVFCKVEGLGHWVWDRAAEATWTFFERT
jgi:polyhydroxybutyrate depolymerase